MRKLLTKKESFHEPRINKKVRFFSLHANLFLMRFPSHLKWVFPSSFLPSLPLSFQVPQCIPARCCPFWCFSSSPPSRLPHILTGTPLSISREYQDFVRFPSIAPSATACQAVAVLAASPIGSGPVADITTVANVGIVRSSSKSPFWIRCTGP